MRILCFPLFGGHRSKAAVSLTPLIDVVFILLIFFMLVSSLERTNRIDLRFSSRDSALKQAQDRALLVTVNQDTLHLNGQPVSLAQLQEQVTLQPWRQVALEPAEEVSLQRIVNVLDQLHGAGARQVAFLETATGE